MTDSLLEAIAPFFNPEPGRSELVPGLPMDDYRRADGFAPSDLKWGDPELKPDGNVRGHVARIPWKVVESRKERERKKEKADGSLTQRERDYLVGTVYHSRLFDRSQFDREFITLTQEHKDAMCRDHAKRKAPKTFSANLKEAQDWKKRRIENGLPAHPTEEEKAEILHLARTQRVQAFTPAMTEYKVWAAEQAKLGRQVVSSDIVDKADAMIDAIENNPMNVAVKDYLKGIDFGARSEVSMFCVAKVGDTTLQLKGRPDLLPAGDDILDPKSAVSVHPEDFQWAVHKYGYDVSMGGYALMTKLLAQQVSGEACEFYGLPKGRCGFLAQEKTFPYVADILWLDPQWLNYGAWRVAKILRKLVKAWTTGDWSDWSEEYPGGGEKTLFPPTKFLSEMIEQAPNVL